jgi:hypothetical protein
VAPQSRCLCVNDGVTAAGSTRFRKVGIGKIVILRLRTTVRRIACIIDTYKDSASVKDDIGRE